VIEPLPPDTRDYPSVFLALRELFSRYPAAAESGPDRLADLLCTYLPLRPDESQVEAALEALCVDGKVLA
jgi:hypothetical protein